MNDALRMVIAGGAGGVLGAFFFGGLWWTTTRKVVSSHRPELWFVGSGILRMGITLAGFYWVSSSNWERLAACLIGFVTARLVVTRLTRSPGEAQPSLVRGAQNAPQSR